jgi:hypothetical protein
MMHHTLHPDRHTPQRRGLTLVEIVVVLALITALIVMTMPLFRALTGSRSVEGAQTRLAGFLGQARAEAIKRQGVAGVLFLREPSTGRLVAAIVQGHQDRGALELELAEPPRDFLLLPAGVTVQLLYHRQPGYEINGFQQKWVGLNPFELNGMDSTPVGGAILFNGRGHLIVRDYHLRMWTRNDTEIVGSRLGALLLGIDRKDQFWATPPLQDYSYRFYPQAGTSPQTIPIRSSLALTFIDSTLFHNLFGTDAERDLSEWDGEEAKEKWIGGRETDTQLHAHSIPLIVNRYSGALTRSQ